MKLTPKTARKFQEGGAVMPEEGAGAAPQETMPAEGAPEQSGNDPLMQLAQMSAQAIQAQDCQMAMQVCEAFIQLIQQAQGGGAPQGQPVYRKGGKFIGYKR